MPHGPVDLSGSLGGGPRWAHQEARRRLPGQLTMVDRATPAATLILAPFRGVGLHQVVQDY